MLVPVWITLEQLHLDTCLKFANKRQTNADLFDLPPHNGAPNDPVSALAMHEAGIYGECAGKLYLNPVKWNAYRAGTNFREADLEDWIDIKTRSKDWHSLIVQADDPPEWAYVLACGHAHPRYCLIGWCYGKEVQKKEYWADPAGGRPAYFVKQTDPVLRPMQELYDEVRLRQARRPHYDEAGRLIKECLICGAPDAPFGYGVFLRRDKLGTWFCKEHRPT